MTRPDSQGDFQGDLVGQLQRVLATGLRNRYELQRPIGAGAMAVVFAGRDLERNRPVAIKVMNPEIAGPTAATRFVREIMLTAGLQHPHIVPVLSSGEVSGVAYLVMPLIEGEALSQVLTREPQLPIPTAIRYTCDVASALDYAHRKGVVHRDIKPENILISDGFALVADFGIARALGLSSDNSLTGAGAIGTPAYMSPEQTLGNRDVDGRSDIYSLGCIAYEMLAGRRACDGASVGQLIRQKMEADPPPLATFRPDAPPALIQAIDRALAREPENRFQTGHELADALGEVRTPSAAPRRAPEPEPEPAADRGRAGLWLVVAAVAALLLLLATLVLGA